MQEKGKGIFGKIIHGLGELTRVEEVYVVEGVIDTPAPHKSARGFTMEWMKKNERAKKVLSAQLPEWKDYIDNGEALGMIRGQASTEAKINRSMEKAMARNIRRQLYQIYLEDAG